MTRQTDRLNTALAGRYRIERELGAGGMATVYLARDLKHERNVALKVLKPELGAVLGVERFLSEIRVTANLQHPNLLPLFDSGEANGLLFYVMPFVEGETLRARLEREKQLPVDEAVRLATGVAAALDYAHRHGVIHRDLKPENILVQDGQPVIADFGIALAVSNAGGNRITQTGLSLGTPQYMSPEQATGDRAIDGRTDIYSLGAMVYEMLVGDPPHIGSTSQAIIAKVLTETPRGVRLARPSVPVYIEATVAHALEKLPADRFATAHEFSDALNGKRAAPASGTTSSGAMTHAHAFAAFTGAQKVRALLPWGIAALAVATAAWAIVSRPTGSDDTPVASALDLPDVGATAGGNQFATVAVSHDGEVIAYVTGSGANDQLYVRRLSDVIPLAIASTKDVWNPWFSPDGQWIAVIADGKLQKVPTFGGSLVAIADAPYANGGTWGADGSIVTGQQPGAHGLVRFSSEGGAGRVLTKGKNDHGYPLVLDDGKTILFMDWGPGFTEDDYVAVASLETGEFTTTNLLASQPLGVVDGRLVYLTVDGRIMAVPFDVRKRRVTGEPLQIVSDALGSQGGAALSPAGTLVYLRGSQNQRLVLIDSSGTHVLTDEQRLFATPTLSPDGQRIALSISAVHGSETTSDIWTFDRRSRTFTRLTSMGNVVNPQWTHDGQRLVFNTWFDKAPTIWIQKADGSAPAEKVLAQPDNHSFRGVVPTPDGHGIVYCARTSEASTDSIALFYLPLGGARTPETLVSGLLNLCDQAVSPDGHWLAYDSNESGTSEVVVRPFRAPGARVQVSQGGGAGATWSHDGRRLVYGHSGKLTAATLRVSGSSLDVERREPVLPTAYITGSYDLSADGRQLLTTLNSDRGVQLVVVKHWLTTLRARVAAAKR